ncbi:MAG: hypothetical protein MJY86_02270 [Bacteroidales bacterium]|nr:hypothetical protein [Bacteroidales bacterium]
MKKNLLTLTSVLLAGMMAASCSNKGETEPEEPDKPSGEIVKPDKRGVYEVSEKVNPFTWIAIDGQGNTIDPDNSGYQGAGGREKKQVSIFYFLWHGCHGYDHIANQNDVMVPSSSDVGSPYDIEKLLADNPTNPAYGDFGAMHHWGEPMLGYYVSNDDWVIRKHAQMLVDAGVDAIFFDVTNGFHYLPVARKLFQTFASMRSEGTPTPQFAFLCNANTKAMVTTLYNEIYKKGEYKDLWYQWIYKPLILADKSAITDPEILDFFQFRQSWFLWNQPNVDTWFGDGVDKWPWGGLYPQQAGIHNGKNEFVSVLPATHPSSNIGRSYNAKSQSQPSTFQSGKGLFFKSQFEQAMKLDPTMMFFTGWNEWTAQRQYANGGECNFLGRGLVKKGDTYFVDQYNHEYSRDIEPLNGDFGDNYYYMLVDFVRKFKGSLGLPTFTTTNSISVDGSFSDWSSVEAMYGDYKGDVTHRSHFGYGRVGTYTNNTGRNDFVLCKVANDGTNVYFYAKTKADITASNDPQWMQLFLHVDGKTSWEGFDYAINRTAPSASDAVLEKSKGGWSWEKAGNVKYKVAGNEIEIAVPLASLGITSADSFTIDFKWIDNAAGDGDIQTCMRDGDSAPDGRFRYRYKFHKQ